MKRKPNPFPMEAIFPGIHKERPDIAAADAEAFLAYGNKTEGFDIDDSEIRAALLDCAPAKFRRFKVKPRQAIQKLLDGLPKDWEQREECHSAALAITDAVDELYNLRKRNLGSLIMEERELWISRL